MFEWDWADILEFTATHQMGVALLIGFVGIIFTLLFNGWRERRANRYNINHQRRILRTALLNEAKIIRFAIEHRLRLFKGEEEMVHYDKLDTSSMSEVYRAHLDRMGLLTDREVEYTVGAYSAFVDFVNAIDKELRILSPDQGDIMKFENDAPAVTKVLWMYEKMLDNFEQAIQTLQKNR